MQTQPKTILIKIPAPVMALCNAPVWAFHKLRPAVSLLFRTVREMTDQSAAALIVRERRALAVHPDRKRMLKREFELKAIRKALKVRKGEEREALFVGLTFYEKQAVEMGREKFFGYLMDEWQRQGFETERERLLDEMENYRQKKGNQTTTVKGDGKNSLVMETTTDGKALEPERAGRGIELEFV